MASNIWRTLGEIIVDAADVDLRRFQASLAAKMKRQPAGQRFAGWAAANPMAFEALVRALSVVVQRLSRSLRNKGMLADTLAAQLSALPFEIRRAIVDEEPGPAAVLAAPTPTLPDNDQPLLAVMNDLSLTDALAYIDSGRADGELLGALAREFFREVSPDPDTFSQLSKDLTQSMLKGSPSFFSSMSKRGRPERLTALASLVGALQESSVPDDYLRKLADLSQMEAVADSPLWIARRKQFQSAFAAALGAPASHSPLATSPESVLGEIRYLVKSIVPADTSSQEITDFRIQILKIRSKWASDGRPRDWLIALDALESALASYGA